MIKVNYTFVCWLEIWKKTPKDFVGVTFWWTQNGVQVYSGMRVLFWAMVLLVATWWTLADPLQAWQEPLNETALKRDFLFVFLRVLMWDHDISLLYGILQLLVCVGAMLGGLCKYLFRHEKSLTKKLGEYDQTKVRSNFQTCQVIAEASRKLSRKFQEFSGAHRW